MKCQKKINGQPCGSWAVRFHQFCRAHIAAQKSWVRLQFER